MTSNEKIDMLEGLEQLFEPLFLKERLEIIANYLIRAGISRMETYKADSIITHNNLWDAILTEKQKVGETIGSALAQQGMTILMWLEIDIGE